MKTMDEEFEEWKEKHPAAAGRAGVYNYELKMAFMDAYERGHAAASKAALSSIAKAFTPEPA